MEDFILNSLRGGLNVQDPPTALQADQCTVAENVEWWLSMCGEKRKGTANVTLGGAGYTGGVDTAVTFLFQHLPSIESQAHANPGDMADAELWALWSDQANFTGQGHLERYANATWNDITVADPIDISIGRIYQHRAVSLHGKMFHAYRNSRAADRLHVWDGTVHRRVGLATVNAAPTVFNTGVGTFSGARYYRVRFIYQTATNLLRSEPSLPVFFGPSGTGSGALVVRPTSPGEGENGWELEASIDNVIYYRIGTFNIGLANATDTISAYTVGYQSVGVLSEAIGNYTVPWSARFVVADQDRLLIAGAWETNSLSSTVGWTPVANDPGTGNDERIPVSTANTINLDGQDGGDITGMSQSINGYIFVFKWQRIYKLTRTNNINQAYSSQLLTTARGAMGGSLVHGIDENGNPCLYFLDPKVGPCRIGSQGLQTCGYDILKVWGTVNMDALQPCVGLYYPDKQQVHYWLAVNGSLVPNQRIVLHTSNVQTITAPGTSNLPTYGGEARRGWATWSSGRSNRALCACLFSSNINTNLSSGGTTPLSLAWLPFVGLETSGNRNNIQMCDTGSLDDGAAYSATITSRPQISGSLLQKFGARAGTVLAAPSSGTSISVSAIRDFGIEVHEFDNIDLTPVGAETQVIRPLDNVFASEMYALQVGFGDLLSPSGLWQVNGIAIKERDEESV